MELRYFAGLLFLAFTVTWALVLSCTVIVLNRIEAAEKKMMVKKMLHPRKGWVK